MYSYVYHDMYMITFSLQYCIEFDSLMHYRAESLALGPHPSHYQE